MTKPPFVRRLALGLATGCALAVAGISAPIVSGALTPAMAQTADDFNAALDAYGHWVQLGPYGAVWQPDGVPPDWRPYEYGHWVYTDDWGWYWVSDDEEADWGWVVFHYGRWIHDRGSWFWVPGDDWAPAWVDWRYGGDDIGWAPMPPDNVVDADVYDTDAAYWTFVPMRYIGDTELRRYYVQPDRRAVILRETRIVNRPVHVEGQRFWVNPGLSPGFITGRTHVALHAYNVRPRVFNGTGGVQGAVTVRRDELRTKGAIRTSAPITIQRTSVTIQPTVGAQAPRALGKGERGQLGTHPPRAAQGTPPQQPQTPATPPGQPPRGPAAIQHNGPAPGAAPPPRTPEPEHREERRVTPGGAPQPQPNAVHQAPPPAQPKPPAPPAAAHPAPPAAAHPAPPPQVHAPPPQAPHPAPPPQVHPAPPPAAHPAPPPAAQHAPPPKAPPPKPGEKPPEQPK